MRRGVAVVSCGCAIVISLAACTPIGAGQPEDLPNDKACSEFGYLTVAFRYELFDNFSSRLEGVSEVATGEVRESVDALAAGLPPDLSTKDARAYFWPAARAVVRVCESQDVTFTYFLP